MQQHAAAECSRMNLTDQDLLEDILSQEKYLISAYSTFIPEATCPQLRQVLIANFSDCVQNQYTVFDQMNQMGMYPVKPAPMQEIETARQKFAQMKQQMG